MDVLKKLEVEIVGNLDRIKTMDPSSEEYKAIADVTCGLIKEYNNLKQTQNDAEDKDKQRKEEAKDHMIRNGITAVSVAGSLAIPVWGFIKSIVFEERGTITTAAGRSMQNTIFGFLKKH